MPDSSRDSGPQRIDVPAALPQLGVGVRQALADGEREQHRVLGDAGGRAFGRQRERDAARGERRTVDRVVVADALVMDESQRRRGVDDARAAAASPRR